MQSRFPTRNFLARGHLRISRGGALGLTNKDATLSVHLALTQAFGDLSSERGGPMSAG
jgi:hypothetical protein